MRKPNLLVNLSIIILTNYYSNGSKFSAIDSWHWSMLFLSWNKVHWFKRSCNAISRDMIFLGQRVGVIGSFIKIDENCLVAGSLSNWMPSYTWLLHCLSHISYAPPSFYIQFHFYMHPRISIEGLSIHTSICPSVRPLVRPPRVSKIRKNAFFGR